MLRTAAVVLGLALAVCGLSANSAGASVGEWATYTPFDATGGCLSIHSAPGSQYVVLGEQSNGTYMPVDGGALDSNGNAVAGVPHTGPTNNGQPQYSVQITYPNGGGSVVLAGPGGSGNDDLWWID